MKIVKISSKGQITLPKEVLTRLDLAPHERLLIDAREGEAILKPVKSVADELAGSLTRYVDPSKLGVPFNKIMEETKKKVAKKLAQD